MCASTILFSLYEQIGPTMFFPSTAKICPWYKKLLPVRIPLQNFNHLTYWSELVYTQY
jgi:hypothetical protein